MNKFKKVLFLTAFSMVAVAPFKAQAMEEKPENLPSGAALSRSELLKQMDAIQKQIKFHKNKVARYTKEYNKLKDVNDALKLQELQAERKLDPAQWNTARFSPFSLPKVDKILEAYHITELPKFTVGDFLRPLIETAKKTKVFRGSTLASLISLRPDLKELHSGPGEEAHVSSFSGIIKHDNKSFKIISSNEFMRILDPTHSMDVGTVLNNLESLNERFGTQEMRRRGTQFTYYEFQNDALSLSFYLILPEGQ